MSTKCVFLLAVVQLLVATVTVAPTNTVRCEERLDIIDPSQWPALPIRYFGRDLLSEAKLAAVGHAHGTHSILHTASRDSFLRGSSAMFHLYGDDVTRELVELRGVGLKEIHFGSTFIAILTEEGLIYTVGSNSYGQLAHHGLENRKVFSLVEGLPPVKMMAVGNSFAVAMSHNGTLYSWGHNGEGRLGYPTETDVNPVARRISLEPEHVQVKFLCCGWWQCAVLTDHSEVFTWGKQSRIGRPTASDSPGRVHGIPDGVNIIKIACGAYHTLALSDTGRLFGWGNNDHGELLGVTSHAPSATELELNGRIVRDVVAGQYITIIRTYSPVAEYFGRLDRRNVNTLQAANYTARDVMARSDYGQRSWGTVQLRC